jgi:cell cycle protein kinase DBF2
MTIVKDTYLINQLMMQNFLVDSSGHVKLTDFGLATGALNPKRVESLKIKVRSSPLSFDIY